MAAAPPLAQAISLFDRGRIEAAARILTRLAPDALADLPLHIAGAAVQALCQADQPDHAALLHDAALRAGLAMPVPTECATALATAGKTARAAKLLRDWPAPAPVRWAHLLEQAQGLNRLGEHGAAMQVLTAASARFADNAPLARLRGLTALQLGKPGLARAALEQAVTLDPAQPAQVYRALSILRSRKVELSGLTVTLPADAISAQSILALSAGRYEAAERAALLADLRPDDRVLDLGAGLGAIAMWIKRAAPAVPVTCVEANPALAPVIRANFAANGCDATLIEGLAALTDGAADFNIGTRFCASSVHPVDDIARTIRVASLDTRRLIADLRPTVLSVDIEGAECDVLPALDLSGLRRIVVELHPSLVPAAKVSALLAALLNAGFETDLALDRGDVYVFDRPQPAP